jgi:hypothetical protein
MCTIAVWLHIHRQLTQFTSYFASAQEFCQILYFAHLSSLNLLIMPTPVLSVIDVLRRGLVFLKIDLRGRYSRNQREVEFHKHYGSPALTLAAMWYDMTRTDIEGAKLSEKEKRRGLKSFLIAHFYMWNYTKNSHGLASRFDICEYYARGAPLWDWIQHIAAMKERVIVWDPDLDAADGAIMGITIDATDKVRNEVKHATLNIDKKQCSHKHKHAASKWQLALSVNKSKIVDIYGPCRGGMNDKPMLEASGILDKLAPGKLAIVDRGYIKDANKDKLSWPNPHDDTVTNNYKSRARLRHETVNGRMAFFYILCRQFHHSTAKHKAAFEAVAVTVQYQMDNGHPLFAV